MSIPVVLLRIFSNGAGMSHVKRRWDIPVRYGPEDFWKIASDAVTPWTMRWLGSTLTRLMIPRVPVEADPAWSMGSLWPQICITYLPDVNSAWIQLRP